MTATAITKPAPWPIYISQGATWRESYTWGMQDTTTGVVTPIDLTGWTAKGQVRQYKSKTSKLYATMGFTLDAVNGVIHASLSATDTAAILTDGYYDIEVSNATTGEIVRIVGGPVSLDAGVTQ